VEENEEMKAQVGDLLFTNLSYFFAQNVDDGGASLRTYLFFVVNVHREFLQSEWCF
jgi:hypothetical protein